ncbi:MAG: ISL3 family transposase [Planctomycetaceae bacterium]
MTTRELYKAIGVAGYEPLGCWRKEGIFHLRLQAPAASYRCPQCGNRDVIRRGQVDRIVHAPRIGMDRTVLFIRTPRLECRICQRVLNAALPNVVPKCNYTKSFARIVVDLRKMMTIRDVARYLGVGEGMVRGIDKSYLQKTFGKPRLRDLEVIAIDEIYVGKKNKFFTIVIDWRTGAIVFVGDGKGQDALKPFWKRLRSSKAKIKAVATDMSSAYYAAVIKNIPTALQVFDRFHIVKQMNDKLTQLRRDLQREAEVMNRNVLKGMRWLLVKHPDHLDESKNERVRLQEALDLNRSLSVAYYLKEDLSQIWQQSTKAVAAKFLTDWCRRARASAIKVLITMAKTLESHRTGILNWYNYPISNGPLEGINNKIGALQRMAYGYKDKDYFIAKLYALHLAKFALIG